MAFVLVVGLLGLSALVFMWAYERRLGARTGPWIVK